MIHKDEIKDNTTSNKFFERVLKRYFRIYPPLPSDSYIKSIKEKPAELRKRLANISHIPHLLDILAKDPDPWVRAEVSKNDYWKILGRYKPLLYMPRMDKVKFIRKSNLSNILVFIIFETDLDVLREVFSHPELSVNILNYLRHFLIERGTGAKDSLILELVKTAIKLRRDRILKISSIIQAKKVKFTDYSIPHILQFLLDEDEIVVVSAIEALQNFDNTEFFDILFRENPLPENEEDVSLKIYQILEKLNERYLPPDIPLDNNEPSDEDSLFSINQQILKRKVELIKHCSRDLSIRDNLLTLIHAYLDQNPSIQMILNKFLDIKEIISLLKDETISLALVKESIKILKNHPSMDIQSEINELFVMMSKRVQKQLKEMEVTINAYFDIIFNSIEYPKIFRIRQAMKILETTKTLTSRYFLEINQKKDQDKLYDLFSQIDEFYISRLNRTHLNLDKTHIQELEDVYEMIKMLLNMPKKIVTDQGFLFETQSNEYENQIQKARLLWRSTIGQYLGRLKEFAELLKEKWVVSIKDEESRNDFLEEYKKSEQILESQYKEKTGCSLKIDCKACKKRSCAGERFLVQIEFILGEFIEYIDDFEFEDIS
jgi:hypothetical protein